MSILNSAKFVVKSPVQNALLDLLGESDLDLNAGPAKHQFGGGAPVATSAGASGNLDILDLLGDINISAPVLSQTTAQLPHSTSFGAGGIGGADIGGGLFDAGLLSPASGGNVTNNNHALDLGLGIVGAAGSSVLDGPPSAAAAAAAVNAVRMVALDKNGLNVTLVPQRMSFGGGLQVTMTATNRSAEPIEQFLFQAAVPKSFAVQMLSPSGTQLAAGGGVITQEMRLTSTARVSFLSRGFEYNI